METRRYIPWNLPEAAARHHGAGSVPLAGDAPLPLGDVQRASARRAHRCSGAAPMVQGGERARVLLPLERRDRALRRVATGAPEGAGGHRRRGERDADLPPPRARWHDLRRARPRPDAPATRAASRLAEGGAAGRGCQAGRGDARDRQDGARRALTQLRAGALGARPAGASAGLRPHGCRAGHERRGAARFLPGARLGGKELPPPYILYTGQPPVATSMRRLPYWAAGAR